MALAGALAGRVEPRAQRGKLRFIRVRFEAFPFSPRQVDLVLRDVAAQGVHAIAERRGRRERRRSAFLGRAPLLPLPPRTAQSRRAPRR